MGQATASRAPSVRFMVPCHGRAASKDHERAPGTAAQVVGGGEGYRYVSHELRALNIGNQ
jgi:hypothetical protein